MQPHKYFKRCIKMEILRETLSRPTPIDVWPTSRLHHYGHGYKFIIKNHKKGIFIARKQTEFFKVLFMTWN